MFAVVRTGGKQYRVQEGDLVAVEKLEGDPISQQFNRKRKEFTFAFSTTDRGFAEIFIPKYQYPRGVRVEVSDGQYTFNESTQSLVYYPDINVTSHLIRVLQM